MRVIKLDATGWKSKGDFYEAILAALEAPSWHGRNADALLDSMSGRQHQWDRAALQNLDSWHRGAAPEVLQRIDWMVTGINELQGREPEITFQIDL
jgi:RNAse (barnase) inhibitor barstar